MTKFVNCVNENKPPVIYGDGKQVRAFCHVSDAAKGIIAALFDKNSSGEIYNIGNDTEPISVKDLADKVIYLSNKKNLSPKYVPMEESDRTKEREVYNRIPTIEKAKKELQYYPKVSLDEGIAKIIKHVNTLKK